MLSLRFLANKPVNTTIAIATMTEIIDLVVTWTILTILFMMMSSISRNLWIRRSKSMLYRLNRIKLQEIVSLHHLLSHFSISIVRMRKRMIKRVNHLMMVFKAKMVKTTKTMRIMKKVKRKFKDLKTSNPSSRTLIFLILKISLLKFMKLIRNTEMPI
jgi:hypothetical protein